MPLPATNTNSCRCHDLKAAEIRYKNIERNYGNPIIAMNLQQIQSNHGKKKRNPKRERNRVGEKRRVLTVAAAVVH